jgi:hypothetical protein
MLVLSPRALPTRIGPRLPLTLGPILIAVGMVMMRGIHAGDSYVGSVLPPTRRLRPATDGDVPHRAATDFTCGIAGTPLRPARAGRCAPARDGELPRGKVGAGDLADDG